MKQQSNFPRYHIACIAHVIAYARVRFRRTLFVCCTTHKRIVCLWNSAWWNFSNVHMSLPLHLLVHFYQADYPGKRVLFAISTHTTMSSPNEYIDYCERKRRGYRGTKFGATFRRFRNFTVRGDSIWLPCPECEEEVNSWNMLARHIENRHWHLVAHKP